MTLPVGATVTARRVKPLNILEIIDIDAKLAPRSLLVVEYYTKIPANLRNPRYARNNIKDKGNYMEVD